MRSFRLVLIGVAIATAPIGLYSLLMGGPLARAGEPSTSMGRAALQVLAHDLPLCTRLCGGDSPALTVETTFVDRGTRRAWTIQGSTSDGHVSVSLTRDMATGELHNVVVHGPPALPGIASDCISASKAVEASDDMLDALGIATVSRRYRLVGAPLLHTGRDGCEWYVRWASGDRRASVRMEARTGLLLSATSYRSTAPEPIAPSIAGRNAADGAINDRRRGTNRRL